MYTNTTLTLYSETPTGYIPTYLGPAFLDYVKGKTVLATGLSTSDGIFIMIPHVDVDIKANGKNFILQGEYTQNIIGATATELSNKLKAFKADKEIFLISTVDKKISGSPRMHHYELGCK